MRLREGLQALALLADHGGFKVREAKCSRDKKRELLWRSDAESYIDASGKSGRWMGDGWEMDGRRMEGEKK